VSARLHLDAPDLGRDPEARPAVKDEVVVVEFAAADGVVTSAVGPNHFRAGDALLTGSTGDRWCVSRDRFDARYRAEPGTAPGGPGAYRNLPVRILAKRMTQPFSVARSAGGDRLHGEAGDWLVEYAAGDHGVVASARFASVYRLDPAASG
jgi:hypothetical protein